MKIAIGVDHGGYPLKDAVIAHLTKNGYECVDYGCDSPEAFIYPVSGIRKI